MEGGDVLVCCGGAGAIVVIWIVEFDADLVSSDVPLIGITLKTAGYQSTADSPHCGFVAGGVTEDDEY